MSFTIIVIALTVLVSLAAFNDHNLSNKLVFYPYGMNQPSEYYRIITSGFIHADLPHLAFNMISLYCFGEITESIFSQISFSWIFLVLYLTGIVAASLPGYFKHRHHSHYMALGASGGVSAVIFAAIYYLPWSKISFIGLGTLGIPAVLFGILYLVYCAYMSRKGNDNIGHDAHFWGSVYGFVFAFFSDPTHGMSFIQQITHPQF